jgi:hypothetical protein
MTLFIRNFLVRLPYLLLIRRLCINFIRNAYLTYVIAISLRKEIEQYVIRLPSCDASKPFKIGHGQYPV